MILELEIIHEVRTLRKHVMAAISALDDLAASVQALTAEVSAAVAKLSTIPADDTAAIEAQVALINQATAALTAGVTPPVETPSA